MIKTHVRERGSGKTFDKILIDEGFSLSKDELAKLYYYLGREKIDIEVYGTI